MNILLLVNILDIVTIFDIKNIFYVNFRQSELHGLHRNQENLGLVNLMYKLEILNILDIVNMLDIMNILDMINILDINDVSNILWTSCINFWSHRLRGHPAWYADYVMAVYWVMDPRIRIFPVRIPDPGSKISRIRIRNKEFKYILPTKVLLSYQIFIPDPDFFPFRIPDQDPQDWYWIWLCLFCVQTGWREWDGLPRGSRQSNLRDDVQLAQGAHLHPVCPPVEIHSRQQLG